MVFGDTACKLGIWSNDALAPLFSKSKYTSVVLPVREGRCVPLALVGGNSEEHVEGADLRRLNSWLARCGGARAESSI